MRTYNQKRARVAVITVVTIAFLSVLANSSLGQRRIRIPRNLEASETPEARHRETLERSAALDRAGSEPNSVSAVERLSPRQLRILRIAQIKEDVGRLQVLHHVLANFAPDGRVLDAKRISKTTEEIRMRGARLKKNLAFPESEESQANRKVQVPVDHDQVRTSVSLLSDSILGFLTNPLLEDSNVINAELSTKANSDLQKIIQLSASIKKGLERLQKTDKQSK